MVNNPRLHTQLVIYVLVVVLAYILHACASVVAPEGGEKDTKKPTLLSSVPKAGTTRFTGTQITLEFDEPVQINSLSEQLIITPPLEKNYKADAEGKLVTIDVEGLLKPNTTYYFNFREGIKDRTEGNPADSTELAFSTGSSIDSLSIRGTVFDPLQDKGVQDASVVLYYPSDTLDITKQKPAYLTKTKPDGSFVLNYLPDTSFRLLAFTDNNKDQKYTNKSEALGFVDGLVRTRENKNHQLNVGVQDIDSLRYYDQESYARYTVLNLNRGAINVSAYTDNGTKLTTKPYAKTVTVYKASNKSDSLKATVILLDSTGSYTSLRTMLKWSDKTDTSKVKDYFKWISGKNTATPEAGIQLSAKDSITSIDKSKILLLNKAGKEQEYRLKTSYNGRLLNIIPAGAVETESRFLVKRGFIKTYTDSSYSKDDTLLIKWPNEAEYGTVNVRTATSLPNIIQLCTTNGQVVMEAVNKTIHTFRFVPPGDYKLRVVQDLNKNGVYDGGNYRLGRQPEPIKHYKEQLLIKANWELNDIQLP